MNTLAITIIIILTIFLFSWLYCWNLKNRGEYGDTPERDIFNTKNYELMLKESEIDIKRAEKETKLIELEIFEKEAFLKAKGHDLSKKNIK